MVNFEKRFLDLLCGPEDGPEESGYFHKLRAYENGMASFPEDALEEMMDLADELDTYLEEKTPVFNEDLFSAKYYKEMFLVHTACALISNENFTIFQKFYNRMIKGE